MDQAMLINFKRQELIDINLVRTFLQVTTLSDIVSADGYFISSASWNGEPIPDRHSRLQFARQLQPTVYQRGLWRRLLRSYLAPHSKAPNLRLQTPLGTWIQPSNMIWGAMMWDDAIYRRDPHVNSGERHVSVHYPQHLVHTDGTPAECTFYDALPDWYTATIPRMAIPTDLTGTKIFLATFSAVEYDLIPSSPRSFAAWINQLPPAEHRLLASVYFAACDAEQVLVQYLQLDCTVFIGTDGGKRLHSGSFSWVICSPGREKLVLNAGPVDGWHKCQNSLRSEVAALASVTLYLDELVAFYSVEIKCKFLLFVDSTSAISNVQKLKDLIPKRRFADNADILSTMKAAHPVIERFTLEHVKSHQDDKTKVSKLSFSAQLNVFCDKMATNQLKRQDSNAPERTLSSPLTPRHLPIELSFRNQVISSHYVSRLREEIGLDRHRTFLQAKYKWTDQIWADIAWDSFFLCARRTTKSNSAFRSKLVHNWLHLGHRRHKLSSNSPTVLQHCPMCFSPEDFQHLLTCPSPRALKTRYDAIAKLRRSLSIAPGLSALLSAIQKWTSDPSTPPSDCSPGSIYDPSVAIALNSQTHIGWTNLFRGFISFDWAWVYPQYDTTPPSDRRNLALPLLARTIRALQDYCLALWTGRNTILHEHSAQSLSIVNATLNHDIAQMYSLRTTLSDHLGSYFQVSLADRLKQTPRQRARWLRLIRLATSHSSSSGQSQQLISLYFPYVEHTNLPLSSLEPTHIAERIPDATSTMLQQSTIQSYLRHTTPATVSTCGYDGHRSSTVSVSLLSTPTSSCLT
jgi:hypothetical protein